jgi:hypothetical protein
VQARKFVFVNHSNKPSLAQFHGKAVALDVRDHHVPFPSLFIIHEILARGAHPWSPVSPDLPEDPPWQDWVVREGVLRSDGGLGSGWFKRDGYPHVNDGPLVGSVQLQTTAPNEGANPPVGYSPLALDANTINGILAATREMTSWKTCVLEGTDWSGTAEENMKKYLAIVGENGLEG